MQAPGTGILATDSQGVLDTLQLGDRDPHEQEIPVDLDGGDEVLDCLRPDWDLLIKIQSAMKQMPRTRLQYVKGHQDKTTSCLSLPLLGQLTVDADKLAGNYNLAFGKYRPFALLTFPSTRAHLQLPDSTVTSCYSNVIAHESTAKPLLEYIRTKNAWDSHTLHSIHRPSHAMAIQRTVIPRTHIVKLVYKMLTTNALASKFDGGTRKCPLCGLPNKDRCNILCCHHDFRSKWRNDFLIGLWDLHLQSNTSSLLSTLMLDGFRQWFCSSTDEKVTLLPAAYHPTLRHLIAQQNRIGWGQMFLGRFGVLWCQNQQRYLEHQRAGNDLRRQSLAWQASIIRFIWERWYILWQTRYQDVHGHNKRSQTEASQREVCRQLNDIKSAS
jgi:hypothetical protein